MKKEGIKQATKKVGNTLSKNSPTILTGLSVAGLLTTTVMAVKATPKALEMIQMEEDLREGRNYSVPMEKMDVVKLVWKNYIPTVIMGTVTIGCIIGANKINLRRNAALASVYSITEATLKEYQSKVVETIGVNKEKKIKDEIAKDKVQAKPVKPNELIITGNGETLCFDPLSGRYFKSDIETIRKSENLLNKELLNSDFVSLNDVYYEFGLDNTAMGDEIGWHIQDGMLEFEFSSQLSTDGIPCLVISYKLTPRYDYLDI